MDRTGSNIVDVYMDGALGTMAGLDSTGVARLLACPVETSPYCSVPSAAVVATSSFGMGLTGSGELVYGPYVTTITPGMLDPEDTWLTIARNAWAGVNARHELHLATQGDSPRIWTLLLDAQPVQVVSGGAAGIPDSFGGCVLTEDQSIHCVGDSLWTGMPFGEEEWRLLDGGWFVACAVRASDDVIVCSDGATYDWGPLVDFAAYPYGYRSEDGGFVSPLFAEASVCALTVHNEVKCAGPRYPPDIQEQLDVLNEVNRIAYAFDYLGFQ